MFKFHISRPDTYSSNESELYLPLYIDWRNLNDVPLLPLFTILLELEVVILILSAAVNTLLAVKMWKTSLVHANLKVVYFTHLMEYYTFFCAQLVLMCYQVGWIWVGYDTTDDFLLIGCSLAKMQRLWSACLIVVASVVERMIATYKIREYEKFPPILLSSYEPQIRTLGCRLLRRLLQVLSLSLPRLSPTLYKIDILESDLFGGGATRFIVAREQNFSKQTNFQVLSLLEKANMARLQHAPNCKKSKKKDYSLSERYQIQENARVFRVIRRFVYIIVTNIAVSLAFLNFATKVIPESAIQPYVVLFMEYLLVGTPLIVAVAMRNQLKSTREQRQECRSNGKLASASESNADETQLHFMSLNQMWN